MHSIFSLQGRYNRAKYFWSMLAIEAMTWVATVGVMSSAATSGNDLEAVQGVTLLIGIGGMVLMVFPIVKRLHDIGRPGSHYWLLLVPLYSIYLGLALLFKKGMEGTNEYGLDPLTRTPPLSEHCT
jgi:uncharacterized membrane protein YhaH (DUF805 family)